MWLAVLALGSGSLLAPALLLQAINLVHQLNFLWNEFGQMTDEQNQLPVFLILAAPPRHAGKANAILDDVKDLSVAKILCLPSRISGAGG